MKSLKEIEQKFNTAEGIKNLKDNYIEACKNTKIDKNGIGFGIDDRFSVFSSKITFAAYTGYYGSSSCSTFLNGISSRIASKALEEAIAKHENLILETMVELIENDARCMVGKAELEIKEANEFLKSIK